MKNSGDEKLKKALMVLNNIICYHS